MILFWRFLWYNPAALQSTFQAFFHKGYFNLKIMHSRNISQMSVGRELATHLFQAKQHNNMKAFQRKKKVLI